MKPLLLSLLLIPFLLSGQSLRVMTYNIRYDNPKDGTNNWLMRKKELVDQIDKLHPQIFGIQEGLYHQTKFIDSAFVKYTFIGVGREDGKTKGEFAAIFYDSTKFELKTSDTFWLSETPNEPSAGWDAYHKRICTYGCFIHKKTEQEFWVFNVHLDHAGSKSRKNSAKLLLKTINYLVDENIPVFVMGDFNCSPSDAPVKIIKKELKDAYKYADKNSSQVEGTFNNFENSFTPEDRIDYIFVKNIKLKRYEHRNDRRIDGYFFSDHLPVFVDFNF